MVDARNIKFEDLDETTIEITYNPKQTDLRIVDNCNNNALYNGVQTSTHISFTVEFDLSWSDPVYFDETQYAIIRSLWLNREPFYIYPNPLAAPEVKFLVTWMGNFEFKSATGWLDGWGWLGVIRLVGAETLEEAIITYNTENATNLTVKEFIELWNFIEGEVITS
jgi:hypothetical protein